MTEQFIRGADATLRGVFWDLGQIGDARGPKYAEPLLRRLAGKILDGRGHEPLVFRLCHLVRSAAFASEAAGPAGWLEFFCAPGAGRAGWATGWLRERLPAANENAANHPAVSATADGAVLRYAGRAEPVVLSYGAMPLLAAFMEFLLNTLRYDVLREALEPVSRRELDWRGLQDAANALSRTVYAWLRRHCRPVQESRDFEALVRFLAARTGDGGDFSRDDIDDEVVLAFWRAASTGPGSGFRTFRKTFRAFLRLAEVMDEDALRRGVDDPLPLDGGAGEVGHDPADPCSPGLDHMRAPLSSSGPWEGPDDEDAPPLERLSVAGIKILLAGEARRLAVVEAHPGRLPALALSLLRDAVHGQAQGRISQALRRDPSKEPALTRRAPEEGYDEEAAAFVNIMVHLDRVTAAAYALAGNGDGALDGLDPEDLSRGRSALKAVRRRGFEDVRAGAPEALRALRQAAPAVIELRRRLEPLCERLAAGAPWGPRQREDAPVFREQFRRIYGTSVVGEGGVEP